jgi:hypothetical protein
MRRIWDKANNFEAAIIVIGLLALLFFNGFFPADWIRRNWLHWFASETWWQSVAAIVQAGAAIAMWKATANLVKATRDMIFVGVPAKISVRIKSANPFQSPAESLMVLKNDGRVDLTDVELSIGPAFRSDKKDGLLKQSTTTKVGLLKAGGAYEFQLWEHAKSAVERQRNLPDNYKLARDSESCPLDVLVRFRHSVTGTEETHESHFGVEFSDTGELAVAQYYSTKDGSLETVMSN